MPMRKYDCPACAHMRERDGACILIAIGENADAIMDAQRHLCGDVTPCPRFVRPAARVLVDRLNRWGKEIG